ncbi:pimeloyl-ACP methyl ester carboxylesterase [Chitinivorax tropicus]|uniref:Pimeloyl-ACP methyl ester carboxylesterase n=1 Tax=Chitinivorax tropicus TaxID=714531 RepID=A0A840MRT5_9PROT|nr:DUF3274 domain-containing protein [Chitinivorax tropicus]MBB5020135.1 pimeloyl-ACP methyl ester carboxylesterase [Chitinivorax tropicus]
MSDTNSTPSSKVLSDGHCVLLPDKSDAPFYSKLPLPGVIILVHGVNSDGEWFDAAEQGLCTGLNTRLKRHTQRSADLAPGKPLLGIEGGLMTPVHYTRELTDTGFVDSERDSENFMTAEPNYSPVIRFRYGYKCSKDELKLWGERVWLNEFDYWGGGPFANGCTTLPDLWNSGINDQLFLWLSTQHVNPAIGRDVYSCPSRTYYVLAALRLAKLIQSIRAKQADCPVTVVCHSQGNMVGMGAAFLADRLGIQADSYVMCNPPLSLLEDNFMESYAQRDMRDSDGRSGRQHIEARVTNLQRYLAMLKARASHAQPEAMIDRAMAGGQCSPGGFSTAADRQQYGIDGHCHGRVTLYCNPHDQVISASPVQGIGWRGVSEAELARLNRPGAADPHNPALAAGSAAYFSQRVFACGYLVGQAAGGKYDYWRDRWNAQPSSNGKPDYQGFWVPPSPAARYSVAQGLAASESVIGKVFTLIGAILVAPIMGLANAKINAEPPKAERDSPDWSVPITAPALPVVFHPQAMRYGQVSSQFDEGYDPLGSTRDAGKTDKRADDPYDSTPIHTGVAQQTDTPQGNADTEAQQRYEDRARLRMQARREDREQEDGSVPGEDPGGEVSESYRDWRNQRIRDYLKEGVDIPATDHSTIVTNPLHAELALAYDVAIGVCRLSDADWRELRIEADWRYSNKLARDGHPHGQYSKYFETGMMNQQPLHQWVWADAEANMPVTVADRRVWERANQQGRDR